MEFASLIAGIVIGIGLMGLVIVGLGAHYNNKQPDQEAD